MPCGARLCRRLSLRSPRSLSDSRNALALRPTRRVIVACFAAPALAYASGCARVVLVPESSPIRIAAPTQAKVYALVEGEWVASANRVTIPEGWYCVPPSFVEESK